MPAAVHKARFAPIPATYSRLPHDDETYVMKAYSRHVSHCNTCMPPSHLCPKGQARALDVTQYVLFSTGHAYSVMDLEDNRRMEVEIPPNCDPVRGLLKAFERGALRLTSSASKGKGQATRGKSYDESYYVAPRRLPSNYGQRDLTHDLEPRRSTASYDYEEKPLRYATKPRFETAEPASSYGKHARKVYNVVERRPTYYSVGSRGPLPVPAKNDWY